MSQNFKVDVYRGDSAEGEMVSYQVDVEPGMVVLDAIHRIQATEAPDLAVRWNCKAGKCGSCSADINGKPRLMCMDRMDKYADAGTVAVRPMKTFPVIRDLVTDVSWNYEVNRKIPAFRMKDTGGQEPRFSQEEADRVQEFRKCIECFLCQNVCHVLREHNQKEKFAGPRFFVRTASLEMHPLDVEDRTQLLKDQMGLGYCNITKCCTEVCPEHIKITDNAIIPLKERVVDRFYDPVKVVLRAILPKKKDT